MNKNFFPATEFDSDIYVADYTEFAKDHPERNGFGVVFGNEPFDDIKSLHIINNRKIRVKAVNFENCESLLKDDGGKLIKQCEGLCFASQPKKYGWVLMIELKYCQEKNIQKNVDSAKFQLEQSLNFLRDNKQIINKKDKVYWVISIPDYSTCEPFGSFTFSQDDLLNLKNKLNVVAFFRCNTVEIFTEVHLKNPI